MGRSSASVASARCSKSAACFRLHGASAKCHQYCCAKRTLVRKATAAEAFSMRDSKTASRTKKKSTPGFGISAATMTVAVGNRRSNPRASRRGTLCERRLRVDFAGFTLALRTNSRFTEVEQPLFEWLLQLCKNY